VTSDVKGSCRAAALVVFDLDGTLIDSIGDLWVAINRVVAERGGRPLAEAEVARMVGEGAALLLSRAFQSAGVAADLRDALPRFLEIYDGLLPGQTRPYPGIPELLEGAATRARLAVLTNKPSAATRKILAALGLDRHLSDIVGGDTSFGRKPDPAGLRHLADAAGLEPRRVLMVGDSLVDLRTARAAGAAACVARYGFGQVAFDPGELRGDEWFIDRPDDFRSVLDEFLSAAG